MEDGRWKIEAGSRGHGARSAEMGGQMAEVSGHRAEDRRRKDRDQRSEDKVNGKSVMTERSRQRVKRR
jgi:hypothetical protein